MVGAQTSDPVVMTVNGQNVTRSEFEYSYNKNNGDDVIEKTTVEQYVPLFVNSRWQPPSTHDSTHSHRSRPSLPNTATNRCAPLS